MCDDRFSSSTTCSRWRHETEPGRLDQSLSCRFWKVATHSVTLLLVDPARDGHDEELQHVGKRRHTGRTEQRLSAVTNVATRRASSVESARRTASIGFLDSTGSLNRSTSARPAPSPNSKAMALVKLRCPVKPAYKLDPE